MRMGMERRRGVEGADFSFSEGKEVFLEERGGGERDAEGDGEGAPSSLTIPIGFEWMIV